MEQKAPRLVPGSFALVINNNRNNKIEPKFKGPYKVLGPRDDQNEHMYELQDMVEDQIASHHMSNIVPVDITEDVAMRTARLTANEHVVTNVTGYSGDPRRTGTLLFNLQFDDQDTVYPTLFRDCKLCGKVREYIKNAVAKDPKSQLARLVPQLREESSQRIRRANKRLSDFVTE